MYTAVTADHRNAKLIYLFKAIFFSAGGNCCQHPTGTAHLSGCSAPRQAIMYFTCATRTPTGAHALRVAVTALRWLLYS